MVMMGSRMLFNKLFETFAEDMPEGGWSQNDVYVFSDKQQEWLLDQGCKWHKVCADPGDLILWDSVSVAAHVHPTDPVSADRGLHMPAAEDLPLRRASQWPSTPHRHLYVRCSLL